MSTSGNGDGPSGDSGDPWTSMTVKRSTYQQVKACKRGGETFDDLLTAMSECYDPDEAGELNQMREEVSQGR